MSRNVCEKHLEGRNEAICRQHGAPVIGICEHPTDSKCGEVDATLGAEVGEHGAGVASPRLLVEGVLVVVERDFGYAASEEVMKSVLAMRI